MSDSQFTLVVQLEFNGNFSACVFSQLDVFPRYKMRHNYLMLDLWNGIQYHMLDLKTSDIEVLIQALLT
jgi:hypothetical protein